MAPTVRITFDRPLGMFRVDEYRGVDLVETVTGWTVEDEAEDLALLYAAARELPISRVDLPFSCYPGVVVAQKIVGGS